jgi:hypothetical protein
MFKYSVFEAKLLKVGQAAQALLKARVYEICKVKSNCI